jgi:hypothetical protein
MHRPVAFLQRLYPHPVRDASLTGCNTGLYRFIYRAMHPWRDAGTCRIARAFTSVYESPDGEQGKEIPVFLLTGFPCGEDMRLHKIIPRKV